MKTKTIVLSLCTFLLLLFSLNASAKNKKKGVDTGKNSLDQLFSISPEEMKKYENQSDSITDFTGVSKGIADAKSVPEEYREMAQAKGISPFNMPNSYQMEKMQADYERERYLKWLYIGVGGIALLISVWFISKLTNKNNAKN